MLIAGFTHRRSASRYLLSRGRASIPGAARHSLPLLVGVAVLDLWMLAAKAHPQSAPTLAPKSPALDILLPTSLTPPADLLPPNAPKDVKLTLAFPVGPLAPVTALAYSPDGKRLAVGTYRAVLLWEMEAGRVARVLGPLAGAVNTIVWSAEGDLLAVGGGMPGSQGEVRLYDVKADYRPLPPLTGHTDVVYSLALSPDSKVLASASHDKTVRTWEIPSGKPLLTMKTHSDVVYQVRFTPDGKSLVSCSQDRSVRQVEVATGKLIRSFEGHQNAVTALAIRPDGQFFVSSGLEPRLRWWNPNDGNTVRFSDGHGAQVNDIVFSRDGKRMASAGADPNIRVWDANSGGPVRVFDAIPDWNYCVAFSPDGRFLAGGGSDGCVRIWEVEPGALRATLLAAASGSRAEWAVTTPHGYFATSPLWEKKPRLILAGTPLKGRTADLLNALRSQENALKSLRGENVPPPPSGRPTGGP